MAESRRQRAAQLLLGAGLLGLLVVAAIFVARVVFAGFSQLQPEVAAALALGLATIIVVPITRWYERRRLREEPLQTRKVEVYDRFIRGLLDVFFSSRGGATRSTKNETKMVDFFTSITPDLAIWASDDVLARWARIRTGWGGEPMEGERLKLALDEFEQLFLSIRRDLGHSNRDLKSGDVLRLWINDLPE